jgi:hypothetical protein
MNGIGVAVGLWAVKILPRVRLKIVGDPSSFLYLIAPDDRNDVADGILKGLIAFFLIVFNKIPPFLPRNHEAHLIPSPPFLFSFCGKTCACPS